MRKRLIEVRAHRGWTQEQVAEQIGVDVTTISRWETGETKPSSRHKIQLCQVYKMSMETLELALKAESTDKPSRLVSTEKAPYNVKIRKYIDMSILTRLMDIAYISYPNVQQLQNTLQKAIGETMTTNEDNEIIFTRQEALRLLAVYPVLLKNRGAQRSAEQILNLIAAGVTACGFLMSNGYEDIKRAFHLLSDYLFTLKAMFKESISTQARKDTLVLITQCLLLKSTFADLFEGHFKQVAYAEQAIVYAKENDDILLQIAAQRILSTAYYDDHLYAKALQAAENALHLMRQRQKTPIPGIVQSWVYAGLAKYQAYFRKTEAIQTLSHAHNSFDELEYPVSLLTLFNHSTANLWRQEAMTHYYLKEYEKAWKVYDKLLDLSQADIPGRIATGTRGYLTAICEAALTSVKLPERQRDQEISLQLFKTGLEGAKQMRSRWHFNVLMNVYSAMEILWPDNHSISELHDFMGKDL